MFKSVLFIKYTTLVSLGEIKYDRENCLDGKKNVRRAEKTALIVVDIFSLLFYCFFDDGGRKIIKCEVTNEI